MANTYAWAIGFCALLNVGCGETALDAGSDPDGAAGGPTAPITDGKLIFMSSERYTADLGGLEGADAKCQSLAEAAGQKGEFKAWLSIISTPASKRLTHSDTPYVLSTGTLVANDWADLTKGTLRHKVNQTEDPALAPPNATGSCNPLIFWTGTDERGSQFGSDCEGWTSTDPELRGHMGVISTDQVWSTFCFGTCDAIAPIMCLEQ